MDKALTHTIVRADGIANLTSANVKGGSSGLQNT